MLNKPGVYLLLAVILIAALSIHLSSSAPAVYKTYAEDAFSVTRAYQQLKQIASAPHSIGTPENVRVREYIINTCNQLGLATSVQHATGTETYGRTVTVGNVYNIIATLKGRNNSKAVVIAAHYDSQPNAYGAGDDGASCAAMLETARLLKAGEPLKNDIIFLFTDGEEDGLLGASAFASEDSLLKQVGVVLNFEGRGNAGVSNMFETNPENGWVVREYARSAAHRHASSLNYEIYKVLPNNTDYSVFKEAGIAGLNNAYIEGFVNYHSPTDQPQRMDQGSLQEQGDNMLSLAKHFGNLDIRNTKAPDVTYFDVIAGWLILYPASWNLFFIILGNLLLAGYLVMGFARKQIGVKGFLCGILIYLLVLAGLYFVGGYFFQFIRSVYPLYDHFYASNAYNAHYYFFAAAALTITIFSLVYQYAVRRFTLHSLLAAILLMGVIAMDITYAFAPTAIYFLAFPLIFLLIACLIVLGRRMDEVSHPWSSGLLYVVLLLPTLLVIPPVIDGCFVAFGLSGTAAGAIVLLGVLLGLLLPVLASAFSVNRWLVPAFAFICCLMGLGFGHLHSRFSPMEPLQTNLRYLVDADGQKAYWTSDFRQPDYWNKQFFVHGRIDTPMKELGKSLISDAPLIPVHAPILAVKKDTVEGGWRHLYLHCQAGREEAISMLMSFDPKDSITQMTVDGKEVAQKAGEKRAFYYLKYMGLAPEGFDLEFRAVPGQPVEIFAMDRSMGLPVVPGFNTLYPKGIIPGTGGNSNTLQVAGHYRF